MILSKTPVLSCRPLILPKTVYENAFNMQMGALEGVIESPLGALRVYCVHLGYLGADERLVQIEQLLSAVQGAPGQGGAWTGPTTQGERDWSAWAAGAAHAAKRHTPGRLQHDAGLA